ncbi:asparagine synthase-related protein [Pseudonocardia sp. HH130630-07]|uniref:asparagine synthase-related protein n=1 Tax=Pseudonocardia sp. HH130630-07 TaxID=1690815 RepID=UPI000B292180|nr:asparagine synthase-related protein [Pseudonocardia sp. HH130630-07]
MGTTPILSACSQRSGREAGTVHLPEPVLWRAKNHYPATHDPGYTAGLQELARTCLDVDGVTDVVDRARIDPLLDGPAAALDWGTRLRLERVVDLALWLEHARPELTI